MNLLAHWEVGEDEAVAFGYLSPHPPGGFAGLSPPARGWKRCSEIGRGHGFDLEKTRLRHFLRLSRLTLAVALLYLWLLSAGSLAVKRGQRRQVDRNDRRDLSLFQIGWRWVERFLVNEKPLLSVSARTSAKSVR